ncbi:MAG: FAD-binding oxidoreductase [Deltaproteobacteria bacterium]|nr:FAD-binding oxidoreductase [Deltaproteobacteria bacterium]
MRSDHFDDNRSAWLLELPPYDRLPALRGDHNADVAIIGGGLTGVSTAWHLSQRFPDRRIVLLEARALANGASGRNGGQVLNWINGVEPRTPDALRRIHQTTSRGIDLVEQLAAASALDAGFARDGCLEVSTTARGADKAERRVAMWRDWGVALEWLPRQQVGVHGAHGAVRDPRAARVNAAALLRGLRPRLLERGVAIYEQTPVLRVEDGAPLTLTTPGGRVRAAAVVLATNAYTPRLGFFTNGILPLHSHVVASGPLPAARWAALGWGPYVGFSDDYDRISYGCRTPGGRLLFGGGSNAAYSYRFGGAAVLAAPPAASVDAIERRLRGYFPGLVGEPIAQRWSGPLAITFDRVCSMGVTGPHRNVFYALGYSGHGLALAALAGEVLTDLYADHHDPWRDLPFYQKALPYIPPEPLRWLGYHAYTRLTGRSPRR